MFYSFGHREKWFCNRCDLWIALMALNIKYLVKIGTMNRSQQSFFFFFSKEQKTVYLPVRVNACFYLLSHHSWILHVRPFASQYTSNVMWPSATWFQLIYCTNELDSIKSLPYIEHIFAVLAMTYKMHNIVYCYVYMGKAQLFRIVTLCTNESYIMVNPYPIRFVRYYFVPFSSTYIKLWISSHIASLTYIYEAW